MSETIKLKFRRGGDWSLERGKLYIERSCGCLNATIGIGTKSHFEHEYAGPYQLEIEEPEPEPLSIDGCKQPEVIDFSHGYNIVSCFAHFEKIPQLCAACATGKTRREAIENFNYLARKMGAQ